MDQQYTSRPGQELPMTPARQVRRFLKSGEYDMLYAGWSGCDMAKKGHKAESAMKQALIDEVLRRAKGLHHPSLPPDFHSDRFVLCKVGPMVRRFFPAKEQQVVLRLFENSLVFVTHDNIEQILAGMTWLGTAWTVANLYLGSLGLPGLDGKPVRFVGLSEGIAFYVSMDYFKDDDPFADYVVHEAAHVFHNWKRDRAGLHHTRKREFLLQIEFIKRELFAYACEAYSKILEQTESRADRQRLLADYESSGIPEDDRVNRAELMVILTEAVAARNGWKRILRCCSPSQNISPNKRRLS